MTRIRRHCTFSNVVVCVCLFVVLGGTSVARDAATAASKLITGKQVKNRSLTGSDIKRASLTGAEVKDGSLAPVDFSGSVVGPAGATGAKGDKGDAGPTGQIQGATAGGDLTGTYPNPTIGAGKVTSSSIFDGTIAAVDLAAALSDATAATPSLRSLGTGAAQAAAGNDARLSDARPPTGTVPAGGDLTGGYPSPTIGDGKVTAAKLAAPAAFTSAGLGSAPGNCSFTPDAWATLSPNVNNEVSYHRDPFGIVSLRGIALRCGAVMNTIFSLPAGYRPDRQEIQPVIHSSGAAVRLNIDASGAVVINSLPANLEWISLDGVTFRCAPPGNGCP